MLVYQNALEQVQLHRSHSAVLPSLQAQLRSRFEGARCCIIGSAPDLVMPASQPNDRYICANGSVRAAFSCGISEPDLTAVTGYATNLINAVSIANQQAWRGRQTRELVFVKTGDTEEHARRIFKEVNFGFCNFTVINSYERAAIIGDVMGAELGIGRRDDRISMGAFAAVLAVWGGASEVVLCGFSLQGGHSYIAGHTPRYHVTGDTRFFELLSKLPVRVSTTSAELQQVFGLPGVSSLISCRRVA